MSWPADTEKFDFWFGFPQAINFRQEVDGEVPLVVVLQAWTDRQVEQLARRAGTTTEIPSVAAARTTVSLS